MILDWGVEVNSRLIDRIDQSESVVAGIYSADWRLSFALGLGERKSGATY